MVIHSMSSRRSKRFAENWAPSPVVGLARMDFDKLATAEIEQIKQISDLTKRKKKLLDLLKDFPDTQAHAEAIGLLNAMQGRFPIFLGKVGFPGNVECAEVCAG